MTSHINLPDLILNIDFLSEGPGLYINRHKAKKTISGSIISIIVLLLIVWYSFSQGKELYEKKYPLVIEREYIPEEIYFHNLSSSNSFIMYSVSDLDNNFILNIDQVLDIRIYEFIYKVEDNKQVSTVNYINKTICNKTNKNPINYFSNTQLENSYCLTDYNISLGGSWDDVSFTTIVFEIDLCQNKSSSSSSSLSSKTCLSYEEQVLFLEKKVFNFYIQSNKINTKDYLNPILTTINNVYFIFDVNQFKYNEIYYKTAAILSTNGWLFDNIITEYGIYYDYTHIDNSVILDRTTDKSISKTNIFISRKQRIFERKYISLMDIVSNLGGVIEIIIIIARILTSTISKKMINIDLMNRIFEFNDIVQECEGSKDNSISKSIFTHNHIVKSNVVKSIRKENPEGKESKDNTLKNNYFPNNFKRNTK